VIDAARRSQVIRENQCGPIPFILRASGRRAAAAEAPPAVPLEGAGESRLGAGGLLGAEGLLGARDAQAEGN